MTVAPSSAEPAEPLSGRERQIACAFAEGESSPQIAQRLNLAPTTVRTHLANIYRKLGVSSKTELRMRITSPATADQTPDHPPRPD